MSDATWSPLRGTTVVLRRRPRLLPALGKGVLTGIGKRPHPDAAPPPTRLVLPAARIDAAQVAAYAQVCGFPTTGPLPLTYPHILGFPLAARLMGARAFPLPLLGLVHTTLEIEQYAALEADDLLELAVYAEGLRAHRRGTEVVMTTEVWRAGRLVWVDRSGYLARHGAADGLSGPVEPGPAPGEAAAEPLPIRAEWPLAADLGRRHAAVSGDYNPIHLHPLTARPLGFRRAIAHGMWSAARCAAEAVPAGAASVRLMAAFRAPVLLPGTVAYAQEDARDGTGCAFQLRGGGGAAERVHLFGTVAA
ncbi:MaoC/PaaZ C-terminal domain-containing protein [Streptomyces sp. NPDC048483]|uniref:MaoC/PaaZ C-terminal domain-containing protein n=1 Tax=Streptomyces sp. NPDC048483 TaxID=3154927 RepID=UPI00343DF280